eukprot:m.248907 g.248907  ORF g.248907 m.248907 type:complete len:55 (-) comp26676_c0_seq1:1508-1672(-)
MKFQKITREPSGTGSAPVRDQYTVKLADFISVARVRPSISKGITDLLLPQTSID